MNSAMLQVTTGPLRGKAFPVLYKDLTIGRKSGCLIRLDQYNLVSREHARLYWDGRSFVIEDLDSKNSILVNRKAVKTAKLSSGDVIQLGDFTCEIYLPAGGPEFAEARANHAASASSGTDGQRTSPRTVAVICVILAALILLAYSQRGQHDTKGAAVAYAGSIQVVLQQDVPLETGSETVDERIQRLKSIKMDGCPTDFRLAYLNYIHAWEALSDVQRDMSDLRRQQKQNETADTIDAISRWFKLDFTSKAQELDAPRQELYKKGKMAYQRIKEEHDEVEKLAVKYGAAPNPKWAR